MPLYQTPAYQTPRPGTVRYQTPAPKTASRTSSSVLGASTARSQYSSPIGPVYSGPQTRTTSSGGGFSRPVDTSSPEKRISDSEKATRDAAEANQRAFLDQIDTEYKNVMESLGVQEQALNTQLPLTVNELTGQAASTTADIEGKRQEQLAGLAQGETSAQQGATGVLNQARQTYNELLSGASRFGGSAAQAYGELLGRSTAQTMGQAQTNLQNTLSQIAGERTRVNQFYNDKVIQTARDRDNAIARARSEFQNEINKIASSKTEAARNKSSLNLQALADFRSRVAEITDAANTAKMALDQWKQERESTQRAVLDFAGNPFIPNYEAPSTEINVGSSYNSQQPGVMGVVAPNAGLPYQDELRNILYGE